MATVPYSERCEPFGPLHHVRSTSAEKDDRKRKRETALVSFERTGSIDGMTALAISEPEPSTIIKASYNPSGKGILKTRPILKGAQQERHKSKSPKKRKVVFDEKTLEELQKEKEHDPPKRKVDEHNTPYHDTYPRLPTELDDLPGLDEVRRVTPPSPKEGHLHFHFNVQFNFTKPKVKSQIFREKTKELILEEGQMFKLMLKAKLREPDDMEDDDMDMGHSIERILKEANLPPPSFWGHLTGSPTTIDDGCASDPRSPPSPSTLEIPCSPPVHLAAPGSRFHFHNGDEMVRYVSDFHSSDEGSPMSLTDAFVFSAPPSSISRCRGFTYCSGSGGSAS